MENNKDKISDKEMIKWHRATDHLFGINYSAESRYYSKDLLKECEHPDAKWLYSCVEDLTSNEFTLTILTDVIMKSENTSRSRNFKMLVFFYCGNLPLHNVMAEDPDYPNDPKYPMMFSLIASVYYDKNKELSKKYAEIAASVEDPRGLYLMGRHHKNYSCDMTNVEKGPVVPEKSIVCFKRSAELGWVASMVEYATCAFKCIDVEFHCWYLKAIRKGYERASYFKSIEIEFKLYLKNNADRESTCPPGYLDRDSSEETVRDKKKRIVYVTGLAFSSLAKIRFEPSGLVSLGRQLLSINDVEIVRNYLAVYDGCCTRARNALVIWILYAKSSLSHVLGKDMRSLISKYIWKARDSWMQ